VDTESIDWLKLNEARNKPHQSPAMFQEWKDLLFLHSTCDPELLQGFLPPDLTLDTFQGKAYLGFVPFQMRHVRPANIPILNQLSIPKIGNFLETNVRTYVTHPQFGPGVWFFSLDANSFLPCYIARKLFSLRYMHSNQMHYNEKQQIQKEQIHYSGTRNPHQHLPQVWEGNPPELTTYDIEFQPIGSPQLAEPNSLNFWLHERYRLYSATPSGQLLTARVWHEPYQIQSIKTTSLSLEFQSNILNEPRWNIQTYSPGVQVLAYPPQIIESN